VNVLTVSVRSGRMLCVLWPVLVTILYWNSVIDFYHSIPVVSMANCISGLYSPGLCSVISLFSWWNLWMKSCSYGINSRGSLIGLTSFIISSIVPYSCLLCRMCCAKADCGLLHGIKSLKFNIQLTHYLLLCQRKNSAS